MIRFGLVHHVIAKWEGAKLTVICGLYQCSDLSKDERTKEIEKVTCEDCLNHWAKLEKKENRRIDDGPLPI